jgi:5-methylcytosine-specific restriction protein A
VAKPDVTARDILTAIEEFDHLGRDGFLARYGFGEARSYFVVHNDRSYDSKAIVGAAHGVRTGRPLTPAEFSGGEATVARLLRALGFTVVMLRNPPWHRDEIVLACQLVYQHRWRPLGDTDPRVIELSGLLQELPLHPLKVRGSTFRNPNGVARKTSDLATQHPEYAGATTHGNKNDGIVVREFLADPQRMTAVADAIRASVTTGTATTPVPELDLDDATAEEGESSSAATWPESVTPNYAPANSTPSGDTAGWLHVKFVNSTSNRPTVLEEPTSSNVTIACPCMCPVPPPLNCPTSHSSARTATA